MNHKRADNRAVGTLSPLALYVHIPWCVRKCPYCDFNSHEKPTTLPVDQYIDALVADAKTDLARNPETLASRSLQSIFFGGGTPSLLPASAVHRLLVELRTLFVFDNDIEITLETNPGTAEYTNLTGLAQAGVNRISLGAQSFNDLHLQKLGRIHDAREIGSAFDAARHAGFANINIDIMHGLPGQTVEEALADLDAAILLEPEHISWYELTIEPNTAFYHQPPTLPDDDTQARMYQSGQQRLKAAGYQQYEVSAYARDHQQSRHNINYWQFGDYIGIGAGAHSKLTSSDGVVFRSQKTRMPSDFLDDSKAFIAKHWQVPKSDLPLEFMMNALRLCKGVDAASYQERTALPLSSIEKELVSLKSKGLIYDHADRIQVSQNGLYFLNNVLKEFMPD